MHRKLASIGVALTFLVAAAPASAGHGHGGHGNGGCSGKRTCANTIVSLDVAASALGLTSAQLKAELKNGKTLAQEAATTGKSLDTVAASITSAAQTALNSAVTNGTLSTGQAQAVLLGVPQQVVSLLTSAVSGTCGLLKLDVGTAASLLGLTNAQLLASLSAGKTIADLAAATGKSVDALVQGLSSASTSGITSAVGSGAVTQSQGTSLTTSVTQSVTSLATKPLGG
jgi:hypothetical protein